MDADRRVSIRVVGVVQGVGFRPFVLRRARELRLSGTVRNDAHGVLVEAAGPTAAVGRLIVDLRRDAPPLAQVDSVSVTELAAGARVPAGTRAFTIGASDRGGVPSALVARDAATCPECVAELRDPADRRYRYPFVNCTNCGPRFTIMQAIPYDRSLTTMAGFTMCDRCQAEYDDPRDRRFHAQPNACPVCGPRVRLIAPRTPRARDEVAAAAMLLRDGAILAIKGLGGYHLACRAGDQAAVERLRAHKRRDDKPLAVMVQDVAVARALAVIDPEEEAQLAGVTRPIVLVRRRRDLSAIAPGVAPRTAELGLMLPYTPLHHLLLADVGEPLVMTSGNVSDEPIVHGDAEAVARLGAIADALLVHDRPIHTRIDDSVTRVVAGRRTVLRRARGLVPGRLALPEPARDHILACGAQLKSTFCVAKGSSAWVSQHIGDLDDADTRASFAEAVDHFQRLFAVTPRIVAHDAHPDYASTAYALERRGVRHIGVQHHHAHLAAVLAEHGRTGPAVGAIYDGAGLGLDGSVWGGELLAGDLRSFARVGHLHAVTLPGGDRAARQPWRMAASWLVAAAETEAVPCLPGPLREHVRAEDWEFVCAMAGTGFRAPQTTSVGRLFDAVSALCGVRATCTYEGQAAMELEALVDRDHRDRYELPVTEGLLLDARPVIRSVLGDVANGIDVGVIAARFHHAVATATAQALVRLAAEQDTSTVVLAGGVFHNRVLLEETVGLLERERLEVLAPERLPAGDGGISFGQAAVAAALSG